MSRQTEKKGLITLLIMAAIAFFTVNLGTKSKRVDTNDKNSTVEKVHSTETQKQSKRTSAHPDEEFESCDGLEIPICLNGQNEQIIEHIGHVLSYNADWHIPNWVAYELTCQESLGTLPRAKHFKSDPKVKGDFVDTRSYSNSGYDRGHMAPAGDMKWNESAMESSFYLSNICPQNPNLNKGDWKDLEEKVRQWACVYGNLYVACGPIVSSNHKVIGYHKVAVPSYFYKVCLAQIEGVWQAIGFYFENSPGNKALRNYCMSVDSIEQLTGIDFFPALDDKIEQAVESSFIISAWGL